MRLTRWRHLTIVGAVLATAGLPAVAAHATSEGLATSSLCTWASTDLPLPDGVVSAAVTGSDGATTLVGVAQTVPGGARQGIEWQNGTPTLLGSVTNGTSFMFDTWLGGINTAGDAVGFANQGAFNRPILYHNGTYQFLSAPNANWVYTTADGIDSAGDVVGTALENDGTNVILVWPAGQPTSPRALSLPAVQGEIAGQAYIEDDGYVVASAPTPDSFIWSSDGTRTALTPLAPGDTVTAMGIRAHLIVGTSVSASDSGVAEWDIAGHVIRTLPGGDAAGLWRINANDTVLGLYDLPSGGRQSAIWQQGQLTGLLATPTNATTIDPAAITDDGVVAGSYTVVDTNGVSRQVPAEWTCT